MRFFKQTPNDMLLIDKNDGHLVATFDFDRLRDEVIEPIAPTKLDSPTRQEKCAHVTDFLGLEPANKYVDVAFGDILSVSLFDHDECVVRSVEDVTYRIWFDPESKRATLDPATTWPSFRVYPREKTWARHYMDYPTEPHPVDYGFRILESDGVGRLREPKSVTMVRYGKIDVRLFRSDLDAPGGTC